MAAFVVRRLLISIPILILASIFVFLLVSTIDPLAELRVNPSIDVATIELKERELGLDKPVVERYLDWAGGVVRGDLGTSIDKGRPVSDELARAVPVTFRLIFLSGLVAAVLGVAVGVTTALRQYSIYDNISTFLAFVFFAMPTFWLAALLKDLAIRFNDAIGRRIFFTVGEQTPRLEADFLGVWFDRIGHILLPSLTLILIQFAATARFQRSAMLDVLGSDYIRTARAKGVPRRKVITKHALRNALLPVVNFQAVSFGALVGGVIITETVFSWSGMGRLFIESLRQGDIPVMLGWLLVAGTAVIVFNLLADILNGYLDPRIRYG